MSQDHTVRAFTEELNALSGSVLRMGGLAEAMIADSARAFARDDVDLAQAVIDRDGEVDMLQEQLEQDIMRLLALRQPFAQDLRSIIGALKVSNDLERIGDLAKNISRRTLALGSDRSMVGKKSVERMSKAVTLQLKRVLDAYSTGDEREAIEVWSRDEEIDEHYNSMFREVLTYMMEDPRTIGLGAHLLFIAKNLERIGDHCTNVAEVVHYLVTGTALPVSRPKRTEVEMGDPR